MCWTCWTLTRHLAGCSAVVVGEGRLDSQTGQGKIIAAVLARSGTTPVYAVVGSVHEDLGDYAKNFARVIVASDAAAMTRAGAAVAAACPANTRGHALR